MRKPMNIWQDLQKTRGWHKATPTPPERRTRMTNRQRYEQDINHNDDYRISIKAFREWLSAENMTEVFHKKLRDKEETLYDIALDFSIPVAMVKYFKKSA